MGEVVGKRAADVVGFYPPSPKGELVTRINEVLEEEGKRIGIKMRAIETGGLSLAKQLVKPDLKRGEPCGRRRGGRPDQLLDWGPERRRSQPFYSQFSGSSPWWSGSSCALHLDGDTWVGRQAKDLGGGVKRANFVLMGGIWGRWRRRMRAQ